MLPIALTCPVWWVARWWARTLASLAVLVACSLGVAALPVGPAATAQAAPRFAAGPVEALTLRVGTADSAPGTAARVGPGADSTGWTGWTGTADRAGAANPPGIADRAGAANPRGIADRAGAADRDRAAKRDRAAERAGSDCRQVGPVGAPDPVAPRRAVALPADRQHVLVGLVPATVGSRAPPTR